MNVAKPAGLRVVLDTNVYFSAFTHRHGAPFRIWRRAVRRQYTLLASPAIIQEVAGILRTDLAWPESEILIYIKLIAKAAEIFSPKVAVEVITDDPDDNRILECALAGRADLIVSGDRHLTRLKVFQGIGIARPADFLRALGAR
jgi:putative PIN family toxin of toxin-antitoxin system